MFSAPRRRQPCFEPHTLVRGAAPGLALGRIPQDVPAPVPLPGGAGAGSPGCSAAPSCPSGRAEKGPASGHGGGVAAWRPGSTVAPPPHLELAADAAPGKGRGPAAARRRPGGPRPGGGRSAGPGPIDGRQISGLPRAAGCLRAAAGRAEPAYRGGRANSR